MQILTKDELKVKIQELKGMDISLAWKGIGSAIFLELGILTEAKSSRSFHAHGEACIWLEWEWRVERNGRILFGSSNSRPEIEAGIKDLIGKKIINIDICGDIPELLIVLSDGCKIQTMTLESGDPQWSVCQKDSTYLNWKDLKGVVKNGDETGPEETPEENEYIEFIDTITKRLGKPIDEPYSGNCKQCKYYFPIDGDFALSDYGVCLNIESKFDQQVVRTNSGCPYFVLDV
jgi:hypothetical protein